MTRRTVHPVPREAPPVKAERSAGRRPEEFFPDVTAARPVRWRIERDKPWYGVHHANPARRWLVWQKAKALADEIDKVANRFPDAQRFGLIPQMRRASRSIPASISSGSLHSAKREKRRCYQRAQVSLAELDAHLRVSRSRLRSLNRGHVERLAVLRRDVRRLLKVLVHFVP